MTRETAPVSLMETLNLPGIQAMRRCKSEVALHMEGEQLAAGEPASQTTRTSTVFAPAQRRTAASNTSGASSATLVSFCATQD